MVLLEDRSRRALETLDDVFRSVGEPHLGHDTLVFPRSWLSRL